jgi:hypothetical protein
VAEGGVSEQGVDGRQSSVACSGAVGPLVSKVDQEGADGVGVQVDDVEFGGSLAAARLFEGEQQPEGVSICDHCVGADLTLVDETVSEERLQGRG